MTDADLYELVQEHAKRTAIPWFTRPYDLNCWGFRSPMDLEDMGPTEDPFNDVIAVGYRDDMGKPHFERFKATTDPGRVALAEPSHPVGTFTPMPQRVAKLWEPGLHKGKYPALRQRAGVDILGWRGKDRKTVYRDARGINLHHAYGAKKVGRYSEGCQVTQAEASLNRILYLLGLQVQRMPEANYLSYVLVDTEEVPMLEIVLF